MAKFKIGEKVWVLPSRQRPPYMPQGELRGVIAYVYPGPPPIPQAIPTQWYDVDLVDVPRPSSDWHFSSCEELLRPRDDPKEDAGSWESIWKMTGGEAGGWNPRQPREIPAPVYPSEPAPAPRRQEPVT